MKLVWQRYDEEWARFELDHLTNPAPIPHSAQFLLIHLLMKDLTSQAAMEVVYLDSNVTLEDVEEDENNIDEKHLGQNQEQSKQ